MKEWKLEGVSGPEGPSLQSGNAGDEKEARNKAVYYLQFSSKTEWELRKKLAEQGFLPASVDSAIRFVKAHRYLDDGEYAARYIERNQRKQIIITRLAVYLQIQEMHNLTSTMARHLIQRRG